MVSNRLAFAALAVACIAAAAGGGYLATRQNTVPTPASAQAQPEAGAATASTGIAATASGAPTASAKTEQETEPAVETPRKTMTSTRTGAAKAAGTPARTSAARDNGRPATFASAHREPAPLMASNTITAQSPLPAPPMLESAPEAPKPDEQQAPEPLHPIDRPQHAFTELVVSADSVIGLQTESRVSSETARVEDRVEARVTRDVRVSGQVAIPAGTRAIGSVMQVERGGKFKERARLGVRFNTLVLADGTRIPISTETIFRDGDAPSTAPRIGGAAVAGTILGAILGGGKGAAIGAAAGAGAGAATLAAGDRNNATLPAGTSMTIRILQPIAVTIDNK